MPNAEHLNTRQVADLLGRDVATVNRYVREGKLEPTFQFPGLRGARLFAPADVEALAANLEQASS
jgi:predicted site-specific integrase-resolvase